VIDCFAGFKIHEELNGLDIHRLENILTLRQELHTMFDTLALWFEETVCCVIQLKQGIK
jgi:hypothetical protein